MDEGTFVAFLAAGFVIFLLVGLWTRTPAGQPRIDPAKARDNTLKLFTVAIFDNAIEANFAKTRLEDEDIECFIEDEFLPTMNWFMWNTVGGVKLKVRESDTQNAKEILTRKEESAETAPKNPENDEGIQAVK